MRKAIPLLLVALILSACTVTVSMGGKATATPVPYAAQVESAISTLAALQAQSDVLYQRAKVTPSIKNLSSQWADDVLALRVNFKAQIEKAHLIQPPPERSIAHTSFDAALGEYADAMAQLAFYAQTDDREKLYGYARYRDRATDSLQSWHEQMTVPPPD